MSEEIQFEDVIYRYRPYDDNSVNAFKDDRLYFSTPNHFNDPFDSVMYINEALFVAGIVRAWNVGMDSHLEDRTKEPLSLITPENKAYYQRFFETEGMRKNFLDMILKKTEAIKNNVLKNSKVICFSKQIFNTLMWSHYAHYHEGFALAYLKDDLRKAEVYNADDKLITTPLRLGAVRYQSQMPDCGEFFYEYLPKKLIDPRQIDYSGFFTQLMFNKTKEWAYEEEWRLCSVRNDYSQIDNATYISARPIAIFLGAKMPSKKKWQLYNIAKKKGIPVLEVWTNSKSSEFKLNAKLVDPQELKRQAEKE